MATQTATKTLRAAVYARISSDPNGTTLGVQRQEEECRALIEREGWTIADVFIDNDVSAFSGKVRPAYREMLDAVDVGGIDVIVAWHGDRLHRSPRELEDFVDLVERTKTKIRTVQSGELDLTTPSGRMTARVVGAVARGESEHKSARLKAKYAQKRRSGDAFSGSRPFGYCEDRMTPDPTEAAIVIEITDRLLAGDSLRGIAANLDERNIPTVRGAKWQNSTLRTLALNPRYAGLMASREGSSKYTTTGVVGNWTPIIDESTHRRLVNLLRDPARRTNRSARRYLLSGLVRCSCGATLVSSGRVDSKGVKFREMVCRTEPTNDALRQMSDHRRRSRLRRRRVHAGTRTIRRRPASCRSRPLPRQHRRSNAP